MKDVNKSIKHMGVNLGWIILDWFCISKSASGPRDNKLTIYSMAIPSISLYWNALSTQSSSFICSTSN